MSMVQSSYEELIYKSIDADARNICRSLWANHVDTRWSCSGGKGHLCTRVTIIIPAEEVIENQDKELRRRIETTMMELKISEYWLSRVYSHVLNSSGMQHFWMLEIPNWDIDYLAYPISYNVDKDAEEEANKEK